MTAIDTVTAACHDAVLTAEQLAERWQVGRQHVYRLAREGRIPCLPIGRYYRFRLSTILAWEAEQEGHDE